MDISGVSFSEEARLKWKAAGALGPLGGHQGHKGVAPFGGFLGVDVSHGVLRAEEMGGQWGVHGSTL